MPLIHHALPGRVLTGAAFLWCAAAVLGQADPTGSAAYPTQVRPLLEKYCVECHSTTKHKGDLDLEGIRSAAEAKRQTKVWQGALEQLANREMPPKDKPQPSPEERERLELRLGELLDEVARERAGDPGPVVLRRLSNAEYTYTLRDLTGVPSLDPAREFPVDGASGEGFMNAGSGLVMSPTLLTKYLDAARDIAGHAVLLPDGLRFSASTSRRDWTEEVVGRIRELYREFTDPRGSTRVNLQGLTWETNEGGRLPLERYFDALLGAREKLEAGTESIEAVAHRQDLSPKYLGRLWAVLRSKGAEGSLLLDALRARWDAARPADAAALAEQVSRWQAALWKFNSVGHIGKVGGPKSWLEALTPLATRQEVRLKLPIPAGASEVTVRLVAGDAGDGAADDGVVWERPRLVAPGRPDLLLRDLRGVANGLAVLREKVVASVTNALAAVASAEVAGTTLDDAAVTALARQFRVEPVVLTAWLEYLGVGLGGPAELTGHLTNPIPSVAGFDFVRGWGSPDTPNLVANASDRAVRIPGNLGPHGVAIHPSPTRQVAVAWRSPVTDRLRVAATITHAHPECGNGVKWVLEFRRGASRRRLASGIAQGAQPVVPGPIEGLGVRPGDVIALLVDPRDGNHACDLTGIDLVLSGTAEGGRTWNLAEDVSSDVQAGNPHADRFGHAGVWHFFTEPVTAGSDPGVVIPAGSVLARWRSAAEPESRQALAMDLERLLRGGPPTAKDHPDGALYRQLTSLGGPLLQAGRRSVLAPGAVGAAAGWAAGTGAFGLEAERFGRAPGGVEIDGASLFVTAPASVEIRLPADLAEGCELVTAGTLARRSGGEGSVQLEAVIGAPQVLAGAAPGVAVITAEDSPARRRWEAAFAAHRELFPAALAYTRIVPVDEVVTLTLFYREDDVLRRLMLSDTQAARLDRLWDELHFVSQDALTLVDAYAQLMEYATQDADPKVFEPLRKPIQERAAAFRRTLVEAEPRHLAAVLDFATQAYRRPVTEAEKDELRKLYARLRGQELPHDEAVRMTLARVLVAPGFLYRIEKPGPAAEPVPVSDWELATRLSYFLWSGPPDETLRELAASGRLHEPAVLAAEARRMLKDPRVRRLAIEFGCQWLHVHDFDELNEKSERHFPSFANLRGAMYEEAIRFFTDYFQSDARVLDVLDTDHTFLNEALARHYGIEDVHGPEWRRVDGIKARGRGGLLGLAATLAKQSGASRTSPILRGNWVSEVLVGEKLPRPPKDVPRLPEDEAATDGLTVRQLVEKHSQDPRCAGCHSRIDPYGFALEGFDAIGGHRTLDLAGRPIEVRAKTADGAEFADLDGLRRYLMTQRRPAFVRQFCRKLLGYALGRGVLLSDGPLIEQLQVSARNGDGPIGDVVEAIVRSRQFREIRGQAFVEEGAGG